MSGGTTLLTPAPSPEGLGFVAGMVLVPGAVTTLITSVPEGTALPIAVSRVALVAPPPPGVSPGVVVVPPAAAVATSAGGAAAAVTAACVVVAAVCAAEKPGS